jgi:hypothetical protein
MRRAFFTRVAILTSVLTTGLATAAGTPPGLGNPGELVALAVRAVGTDADRLTLAGRDARAQIVVDGQYSSGQIRDLTRDVNYDVLPEDIVAVDSTGYVVPLQEGTATIRTVAPGGQQASVTVAVSNLIQDLPVNFPNQIVPVFTKFGCNGGGCHGKSGGQNGFRLSLLGFVPEDDYRFLVREARGRRLFPAAPDHSLLLLKAAGLLPHGGGARINVDSQPYRLLRRWIEQGMPYGSADDPTIERIEVLPHDRVMPREGKQQLVVLAHYSDGSVRDVTRMAQFESNEADLAEASETGLVTTGTATGSVAVMARYQSQVDVFRATVPLGLPVTDLPTEQNFIDELAFDKLRRLGLPPSPPASDSAFARRVTIDIAGRLPTLEETQSFLRSSDPRKRQQLVDRLLKSPGYADYFANKWSSILRNQRDNNGGKHTTYAFHDWIRESLLANKPFDQFAREILAASGQVDRNPAISWYHQVRDPAAQVEDTAQLFLGMRIQCARCHHHPFEKWSQQDYYGMAAFFARVGRKDSGIRGKENVYHRAGRATAKNPQSGQAVPPTPLGDAPLDVDPHTDPRLVLADWLAQPDNPFFAKALVNRYWKHFFGRGLVDPEDDMRVTNPASNPELLDALAKDFVDSGFDLKALVRRICSSQLYGLSALPHEYNQDDKQNFSRFYPRRLHAEVLLDAIDRLTDSPSQFAGMPSGTRAVQLPDNAFDSYFLTVFGRPDAASACECERSDDVNLAQCLHLLNSADVQQKVSGQRAQALAVEQRPHSQRIRELYLRAYSREPTRDELATALAYLDQKSDQVQQAYEDILWAIINTKEFVFNH